MSRQVTTSSPAPLDWYVQVGGLTIGILIMVAAPDWVIAGLKSAYNAVPFAPKVEVASSAQQSGSTIAADAPTTVTALRIAIIGQESGGRSDAVNHSGSGATGLGQVMPENISAWSQQCLGRSLSQDEFKANADLQIKIIDCKLSEYWQQVQGDEETRVRKVAAAWYSGQSDKYDDPTPQYWNGNAYPSIRDYSLKVLERWKEAVKQQPAPASSPSPTIAPPAAAPPASTSSTPASFVSVQIPVVDEGTEETVLKLCSGFAVAPNRIVTALHCVKNPQETVVIDQAGNLLKGVQIASAKDTAIVSVLGANFTPAQLGTAPVTGAVVTSWGHPGGSDPIAAGQLTIASNDGSILLGQPAGGATVVGGFSGGPVVNDRGEVVGMNSEANPAGMVKVQSIDVVKQLMGGN